MATYSDIIKAPKRKEGRGNEKQSDLAISKTKKVEDSFKQLENILLSILDVKELSWDVLIEKEKYLVKKPVEERYRKKMPVRSEYPVAVLQEPVYKEASRAKINCRICHSC